jgi:hypothetical protein
MHKNCFPTHVIELKIDGRIEVKRRQGRRFKELLGALRENRR